MPLRQPHGYTNLTRRPLSGRVEKRYEGIDGAERCRREVACLSDLRKYLPVPEVFELNSAPAGVVMSELTGRHGQELLDEGHARLVMRLVGSTLRTLQALPVDTVAGIPGDGDVLVHGDFGPQNMLFDLANAPRVTAVLDWEFAHLGQPVEDLAWAEWIVRTHHSDHIDSLEELLAQSGVSASWTDRHAAMVRRCHDLLRLSSTAGSSAGEVLWRERLIATEAWTSE